ncbi:MAG: nucleotidyltransferase domain-containing protein [Rickettsiales bacterium]
MNLAELRAKKPEIMKIAAQYGVQGIKVFGSVARGDEDENSDVDLMIDKFNGSLLDFSGFKIDVEDLLRTKVDIVEINVVKNPLRKRYMLEDATPL